jgi:hypothetical protein
MNWQFELVKANIWGIFWTKIWLDLVYFNNFTEGLMYKTYNNYSKSFLIFKQFDMKEEVNLRIEYDLLLKKKLILL